MWLMLLSWLPKLPFLSFLSPFKKVSAKIWIVIGGVAIVSLFVWRWGYLELLTKNYKAGIRIEQNRIDSNRELVEELSRADDELMYRQQRQADDNGQSAKQWLLKQSAPKDGMTPKGYVDAINGVR